MITGTDLGLSAAIGIDTFLSNWKPIIDLGDMQCTFFSSSRNSAPNIQSMLFSLLLTMNCVQNFAGSGVPVWSRKFKCAVPDMALLDTPVAVANLIRVGATGIDSFSITDVCNIDWEAPVSTSALNCSA